MSNNNKGLKDYFWITITWLITSILLRVTELIMVLNSHIVDQTIISEIKGICLDFITVTTVSAICLIPYLLIRKLSTIIANVTAVIISTILVTLHFCFIVYFQFDLKPVDIFIFGYSYSELMFTIQTSGVKLWWAFAAIVIILSIISYTFYILRRFNISKTAGYIFLSVILIGLVTNMAINKVVAEKVSNESQYFMMINKSQFFYERLFEYFFDTKNEDHSMESIKMAKLFPNRKFVSDDHPLLSDTDFNDVIGNYFNVGDENPNIVIIISEGLASKFVGNYKGANYMPYLTELASNSLYWDNFLSTGERSNVAAPSILASAPYGEMGFAREANLPYHLSFVNILKDYNSSFYYGQGAWFHNKDSFLKSEGIDKIVDKDSYPSIYKKVIVDNYFWGYNDKDLFNNSINEIETSNKSPRLDIYFTGTMHPPFSIPNKEYYEKRLDSLTVNLSENDLKFVDKYKTYLLSLMYTDDAYREFFTKLSKRDDFNNTIFIITGDHPVTQFPMENTLERFHVPLFIYSPMLNKPKTFHSVNSHLDILPTFVSFFKNKYNMDMPTQNAFIGKVIDTFQSVRCKSPVIFMNPNGQCVDMFYKNLFIANNRDLYKVNDDLSIERITNKPLLEELTDLLPLFSDLRISVCKNNNLIPDTLFFKATKPQVLTSSNDIDSIYISSSDEYVSILNKTPIKSNSKYVFEFKRNNISQQPAGIEQPIIVIDVKDDKNQSLYWNSFSTSEKLPIRTHIDINSTNNPTLSIYIWNKTTTQTTIYNPSWKVYTP